MIPSQFFFTIELFSSFKFVVKKHSILKCSDELIRLFCNWVFNIRWWSIELQKVKIQSHKKKRTLIEKPRSSKIRLVSKRRLLASKQGFSLLRLSNNSNLRCLKLQCYEQQSNKEICSCSGDVYSAKVRRELIGLHSSSVLDASEAKTIQLSQQEIRQEIIEE